MIEEVRRLAQIEDHKLRLREAARLMAELQDAVKETSRMRRESIQALRERGLSMADVARLMGISRARVAQLKDVGPPPERAFLGTGKISVAVPERPGGRRLVARADAAAGQTVLGLANALGLSGDLEYIPLTGEIDLNRDGLVVICGPKSSPVTAETLRGDPVLNFSELTDGRWAITERATSTAHTSPSDDPNDPRETDIAYLGRLPRPDGQGSFLYIAGVHAIGSLGAAHYLNGHLAELYDQVGTDLFSMVITSDHDQATEEIHSSHVLTSPQRHEGEGKR
ncbi:sigma-70 family RNA polymerase sigma factor [Actinomadura rubrisoli]|uniref:Sigma-70 family RNA polymerase sigma factor n=1 Tax=Actinomadura rubrisoli TaxID=2530368 RepID=A0A4R5AQ90_9ACTN|nr:sigma-70 family RNA polymerase sigma factor [Actinomadura rubrisoli]TDD74833.1 sigma-70 family RNA polymerase sigma factor [Actinomadura rubrisoli]